ncbi:hypothetical protein [Duganella caerulea]|uniref:hypothetical protein n=1 Tax=Duganella caerulea TaxID=2885762 RepID=UPI00403780B8
MALLIINTCLARIGGFDGTKIEPTHWKKNPFSTPVIALLLTLRLFRLFDNLKFAG